MSLVILFGTATLTKKDSNGVYCDITFDSNKLALSIITHCK